MSLMQGLNSENSSIPSFFKTTEIINPFIWTGATALFTMPFIKFPLEPIDLNNAAIYLNLKYIPLAACIVTIMFRLIIIPKDRETHILKKYEFKTILTGSLSAIVSSSLVVAINYENFLKGLATFGIMTSKMIFPISGFLLSDYIIQKIKKRYEDKNILPI